ncbi:endonuclease/exonuclease/phosphatase family protein [Mucilaginibacter aquaedulcis]|uniref:endonuclease/exonuclease/phosphatase family protein n=1 Tax=Mucilaginibacter aquaedulcis TaxID=1187081 RepID=UPI0025B4627C|nr:endonuclease/exonuclease/phosphatase family protein [Mucilaginibacter aquaedulcis]MDN3551510.1 endonuclease/exonuclease/phosphatase family protein [Mucilaginibacter aquaedulcis]
MKLKHTLLVALGTLLSFYAHAQNLIVGTYNLRYANARDTGNMWVNRAPIIASLIRFHDFDVFGTQEGLLNQLQDINAALPQYERYGLGRDDGKDAGEHSAIFFKKERFKLLNKGDFWLSQTPEKPSLGWDATCCNRICSWVYLQDKLTKKKFYFFNAHYDHQGKVAREESSKLILDKIKTIAGKEPAIFTGDFNGSHESSWYQRVATSGIMFDTYTKVEHPYANNASFNGFRNSVPGTEIIDHVFVSPAFNVKRWGILTDTYHGKFPSDHFPVLAEVAL